MTDIPSHGHRDTSLVPVVGYRFAIQPGIEHIGVITAHTHVHIIIAVHGRLQQQIDGYGQRRRNHLAERIGHYQLSRRVLLRITESTVVINHLRTDGEDVVDIELQESSRIPRKTRSTVHGGPVYYIRRAFDNKFGKFLSAFFAIAITLALGFMGSMVQSNSIGETFSNAFNVPTWIIGVVLVAICGFIFLGGVQRLASVTEKIVPIMAAVFLAGGLIVLIARIKYVPATFGMIFRYAFAPQAIIGGGFGAALKIALSQGAKRGLFSNEAGMGSTPRAHDQGVVAMIGVFIDTFVVLTLNALVIISTLYTEGGPLHGCGAAAAQDVLKKTNLAQTAFGVVFGESAGAMFVAVCLFFFAFSTILGWNLFGKINMAYLFGQKSTVVYTVIALVFIFLGTLTSSDLVWELSDMFNNLMVIPNAIALFALTGLVVKHVNGTPEADRWE